MYALVPDALVNRRVHPGRQRVHPGFSGDGGPATSAMLALPQGVTADNAGNIYFADNGAAVAGPPSPEKPGRPLPAIVLMMPAVFTLRMLAAWEIYIFPALSIVTLPG